MAENDVEYLDPKELADGRIFNEYKEKLISDPSDKNLYNVLGLLRDSRVFLPMVTILSDADKARLAEAEKNGEQFEPKDPLEFAPDTVTTKDGGRFIPAFSQTLQIPNDYYETVQFMPIPVVKLVALAHKQEGTAGIVIDPFTKPLNLPFKMADIIPTIPSSIKPAEPKAETEEK